MIVRLTSCWPVGDLSNQELQRLFDSGFKVPGRVDGSKVAGYCLALDNGTKHTDHFRDCLERLLLSGVLDDPVVLGYMRSETRRYFEFTLLVEEHGSYTRMRSNEPAKPVRQELSVVAHCPTSAGFRSERRGLRRTRADPIPPIDVAREARSPHPDDASEGTNSKAISGIHGR